jgi:hypothetical protein
MIAHDDYLLSRLHRAPVAMIAFMLRICARSEVFPPSPCVTNI